MFGQYIKARLIGSITDIVILVLYIKSGSLQLRPDQALFAKKERTEQIIT
jgi:hypothetical protein